LYGHLSGFHGFLGLEVRPSLDNFEESEHRAPAPRAEREHVRALDDLLRHRGEVQVFVVECRPIVVDRLMAETDSSDVDLLKGVRCEHPNKSDYSTPERRFIRAEARG
jgi:hypothetical protein